MIDKERLEKAFKEIILALGDDPNREGLIEHQKELLKCMQNNLKE